MEQTFHLPLLFYPCIFITSLFVHTPMSAYDVDAQLGETVPMKCIYNSSLGSLEYIVWFHDGKKLMMHDSSIDNQYMDIKYYPVLPLERSYATLKITDVRFQDAGIYSCLQYFETGRPIKYSSKLQVRGWPIMELTRQNWTEGESVFSMCCVDTALKPEVKTIAWSINGEPVYSNNSFAFESSNAYPNSHKLCSNVTFYSNRVQNGKMLQCSFLGEVNSSAGVTLNIFYPPHIEYERGTLPQERRTVFAGKNKSVNISCKLEGNPKPRVYLGKKISPTIWEKLPITPFTTESDAGILDRYTFTVNLFNEQDTGIFKCIADNGIGPEIFSRDFLVKFKSVVQVNIVNLSPKQLEIGDNFSISCVGQGYPDPKVQLEKILNKEEWVKLPMKPRITYQSPTFNFTFRFGNVGGDSSGIYRCYAHNEIGVTAKSNNLTIHISEQRSAGRSNPRMELYFLIVLIVGLFLLAVSRLIKTFGKQPGATLYEDIHDKISISQQDWTTNLYNKPSFRIASDMTPSSSTLTFSEQRANNYGDSYTMVCRDNVERLQPDLYAEANWFDGQCTEDYEIMHTSSDCQNDEKNI